MNEELNNLRKEVWCDECQDWIYVDELEEHYGRALDGYHFMCPKCQGSLMRAWKEFDKI